MSVVGIAMVKDEADVIAGTLRHMADEVDRLIVADNGSTDGTRDILADLARELPLKVENDPVPAYYQSEKMTAMADRAHAAGATWIVPFDADELWYAPDRIRLVLAGLPAEVTIAQATLYNHLRTAVDLDDPDPFRSMVWRQRHPGALPKVAVRWAPGAVIHQGNHGADHPNPVTVTALELRHFPARSAEQFTSKSLNGAAAYATATNLPADMGAHWRSYGQLVEAHGEQVLADVFREHWWYLSPTDSGLVHDPAPYMRWLEVTPGAP